MTSSIYLLVSSCDQICVALHLHLNDLLLSLHPVHTRLKSEAISCTDFTEYSSKSWSQAQAQIKLLVPVKSLILEHLALLRTREVLRFIQFFSSFVRQKKILFSVSLWQQKGPRPAQMTWKSNSFLFQTLLKALSGKRGIIGREVQALKAHVRSCALCSAIATSCGWSYKVLLVHKIFRAEHLCADGSVWRRESLLKTCTVPPENILKFLLLPALIPVIHCLFRVLFLAVMGSFGMIQHLTVICG